MIYKYLRVYAYKICPVYLLKNKTNERQLRRLDGY